MLQSPESAARGIVLEGITKSYGSVRAVDHVDLALPGGEFVCLLGPSGCGKTTLLRLIAGLEPPDRGDIVFGRASIVDVPSHKRDFGMVFQSLALFPHMTVAENVGYALKIRGVSRAERDRRVQTLLDMVRLPDVGNRQISQLSGGQRQRIAIARALAIEPKLFLLDEPLSALDAKLREAMQIELSELQKKLGITTIVVTHDQREAMTMADQVVVMKDGKVLQQGAPLELYRTPKTAFVADFIGTTNLIPCRVVSDNAVDIGNHKIALDDAVSDVAKGEEGFLCIRPEDLQFETDGEDGLRATVTFVRDLGSQVEIMLQGAGCDLVATKMPNAFPAISVGQDVNLVIRSDTARVLPA